MRWLVLFLAGCSFSSRFAATDAQVDASPHDAGSGQDAPVDALVDAAGMPDAPSPDAAIPDAPEMAQVSYVQGTANAGDASTVHLMLSQPVAVGDLSVVGVGISGGSITSVTDSAGNTFTSVPNSSGELIYVAANMQASANDLITVTFGGATGYTAATAVYRGLATVSPVETSASASGGGSMLDSGAATTTHPHDLLVGLATSNGTMGAGGGFTKHVGGTFSLIEDQEVTAAGAYHATSTATTNVGWAMVELAIKAAD